MGQPIVNHLQVPNHKMECRIIRLELSDLSGSNCLIFLHSALELMQGNGGGCMSKNGSKLSIVIMNFFLTFEGMYSKFLPYANMSN